MNHPVSVVIEPNRLELSFSLKPRNNRKSDKRHLDEKPDFEPGNVPRVSKMMALAIRFQGLISRREVRDYADLARLGYSRSNRSTCSDRGRCPDRTSSCSDHLASGDNR